MKMYVKIMFCLAVISIQANPLRTLWNRQANHWKTFSNDIAFYLKLTRPRLAGVERQSLPKIKNFFKSNPKGFPIKNIVQTFSNQVTIYSKLNQARLAGFDEQSLGKIKNFLEANPKGFPSKNRQDIEYITQIVEEAFAQNKPLPNTYNNNLTVEDLQEYLNGRSDKLNNFSYYDIKIFQFEFCKSSKDKYRKYEEHYKREVALREFLGHLDHILQGKL